MATAKSKTATATPEPVPVEEPVPVAPAGATPARYTPGMLKQDPETMQVAIRTTIPHPEGDHDWGIMSLDRGGWYLSYAKVESWIDIPNTPVSGG
jgi:hypothetical protein